MAGHLRARGAHVWPLTGRDDEVAVLVAALQGRGAGAVVTGELGVGKTRLAAEAVRQLDATGWSTSTHVASDARRAIPFAALASVIDAPSGGNILEAFDAASERLRAGPGPALVSVDDAQWLDDGSVAFLHHLVESRAATVLLTVRSPHERAGQIMELARSLDLERIQLLALSQRETTALLHEVLPDVGGGIVRRLWTMTSGNPLFLREVVALAMESDTLVQHADGWTLGTIASSGLPDVVDARLDELGGDARHALELVTIGGTVPVELLIDIAGADAVVELERRDLLVTTTSGRRLLAGLSHPLHGELVADRLGLLGRRMRRGELLAAVAAHGRRRSDDLVLMAVWQLEQGDHSDPELLVGVARRLSGMFPVDAEGPVHTLPALRRDLLGTANRLAQAAVDGGGGFDAADAWFQIEAATDPISKGTTAALEACRAAATTPELESRVMLAAAGLQIHTGLAPSSELIEELEALRDEAPTGAARRSVDAILALTFGLFERYDECLQAAERALADPATSPRDRLIAAGPLVGVLAMLGRSTEGVAASEDALATIDGDADQWSVGALVYARIAALACNGRLLEAEELAGQCVLLAEATGNVPGVYLFSVVRAQVATTRGQPGDVIACAEAILTARRQVDGLEGEREARPAYAFLAHAHAMLGHPEEAADALALALALPGRTRLLDVQDVRSEAWVAMAGGHRTAAVEALERGADAQLLGVPGTLTCLHDLVLIGERGVGERMREVSDLEDSPLWVACAAHADAFDAGDGGALDATAERFAELGATLWAADTAAHASSAHAEAGRRTQAAASAARAKALAADCQGAVSPALQALGTTVPKVTKRELEVVRLAAGGRTDQEIADALFVSVRTVESHLHNAYGKLGIRTRAELAALPDL